MELIGRHYENGEAIRVRIAGDRIASVEPVWPERSVDGLPFLAPGLFDIQINGHAGRSFTDDGLTVETVAEILQPLSRHGITRVCPTVVTAAFETLARSLTAIHGACEQYDWVRQMVVGCHLEGPYVSPEVGPRGFHAVDQVRPADWDEFCRLQEAAGGRIRLITVAPEIDGAIEFIRKATDAGIVVALGHTAARTEQITAAVDAGARLSTHLGNGAHGVLPRHPNYIWDQLAEPRLMASIITDGHHLPASVVRVIVRTKTPLRTILTCDASPLAGCAPGVYPMGAGHAEVLDDGRIVIAGQRQYLAGSGVYTDRCVARAVSLAGVTLTEALDMAARNPARLLGVEEVRLKRGSRADLMVFDHTRPGDELHIVATIASGRLTYGAPP
ncbi:MAG TPA: N-acetylglucosamine-6-phosphate deacetylase [Planctomycetaceae bacterium]|nr:N-acetylglucosamine-6-phosphate deacetylase [Planctomycetaceae bacterium]